MERHEREHLNALSLRVAQLEQQLAAVYQHLGLTLPRQPSPLDAVAEQLRLGNKIEAIAIYRRQMNCDLATAKTAVDQLAAQLGFV